MISRFARACFLGAGASTACVSSAGAAPNPSHPAGTADVGAQPFPSAQQFASIVAANRNKMHFAIIVTNLSALQSKTYKLIRSRSLFISMNRNGLQTPDLARVFFPRADRHPTSQMRGGLSS
jgi:hypothetical protein